MWGVVCSYKEGFEEKTFVKDDIVNKVSVRIESLTRPEAPYFCDMVAFN